jgi:thiol-disulfide isomerase/thioredoxin
MRRGMLLIAALACFGAALALLSAAGLPGRDPYTSANSDLAEWTAPQIGSPAPPLRGQLLGGGEIDLAALRGAPVLINFWATWCEPCAVELPDLQRIADETPTRLLAVNLAEPPDVMRAWLAERGLTLDVVLDPNASIARAYWLRGQPTTFVIAPDGVIAQIFYGVTTYDALIDALTPLLSDLPA